MLPVCVNCHRYMFCSKTGRAVVSMIHEGENTPPSEYQLYHGDEYACPECGARVVTGIALHPIAEAFDEPRWAAALAADKLNIVHVYERAGDRTLHLQSFTGDK